MKTSNFQRSVAIHDGAFHADEVTATAFLIVYDLVNKDRIYRTRDFDVIEKAEYVCDVGGIYDEKTKRFDHHQVEYTGPLSSVGMVLLYLKNKKIISEKLYHYFNDYLVWGIDQHDNGHIILEKGICYFSDVVANFLPVEYGVSEEEMQKSFSEALDFCIGYIKRMIKRFNYLGRCREIVKEKMKSKDKVLVFDEAMSWQESFFELGGKDHPALFIVMPSQNHWKLRGIPPSWDERMQVRKSLPEKWAGLHEKELRDITKIEGAVFCHKGRFISIWETKEDALKAAKLVLEENL